MNRIEHPLAFIGGGNMAHAIIGGGLEAGVIDPARLVVADPDQAKRDRFTQMQIATAPDAAEAITTLDQMPQSDTAQIVLAVKPQMFPNVAEQACPILQASNRVIISILAGTPSDKIRSALGGTVRVIRVMPNTPASIRMGMSAIALGAGAQGGDDACANAIFKAVGEVVQIDESLMDAYTALAGSGPAYIFYLAEAMTRAAKAMGFENATADRIVRQTVVGAATLNAQSIQSPEQLRAAVTSKGGTTAAATQALDDADVLNVIVKAIEAARDRGRELAE